MVRRAIACKKLSSRYERPEIIVESLINQFVNIPHVKSNNSSLRKLLMILKRSSFSGRFGSYCNK